VSAVYAVLGWPVAHSRSPAMHNAAFAAVGLDAVYVPLAIAPERLRAGVAAIRALGIEGCNVTLPHKQAIMPLLDEVDATARAIGAVNTVVRRGARLLGENTDGAGLCASLVQAKVALPGARAVVLGTGGAARAAVVGLADAGAERITVAGRRPEQARALVDALGNAWAATALGCCGLGGELTAACADATLLVQATSASLGDGPEAAAFAAALPLDALPATAVVCDLVYKPLRTAVLRRAEALGLRTVDGLGMLLHQGALSWSRWTGQPAPLAHMRAALAVEE